MEIHESKRRTFIIEAIQKIVEVAIDTPVLILGYKVLCPMTAIRALTLAIVVELVCFASHYFVRRLADRVQAGRFVVSK